MSPHQYQCHQISNIVHLPSRRVQCKNEYAPCFCSVGARIARGLDNRHVTMMSKATRFIIFRLGGRNVSYTRYPPHELKKNCSIIIWLMSSTIIKRGMDFRHACPHSAGIAPISPSSQMSTQAVCSRPMGSDARSLEITGSMRERVNTQLKQMHDDETLTSKETNREKKIIENLYFLALALCAACRSRWCG